MSDVEREAFEKWYSQEGEYSGLPLDRWCKEGDYVDEFVQSMWMVWQAASQAPASEAAVGYVTKEITKSGFGFAACEGHNLSVGDPLYTHPPAKVPEDVIVAARGYLLSDGPYDWSSVDRAHAVKVLANRGLLTTPTPATTAGAESCEWHSDENGCWVSACGKEWWFDEGGPEDNGMHFCIKCGKPCVELGSSEDGGEIYDSAL